jgi:hypothetical protein
MAIYSLEKMSYQTWVAWKVDWKKDDPCKMGRRAQAGVPRRRRGRIIIPNSRKFKVSPMFTILGRRHLFY